MPFARSPRPFIVSRAAAALAAILAALLLGCGGSAVDPDLEYTLRHRPGADTPDTPATPATTTPTAATTAATMTLSRRDTTLTVGATLGIGVVLADSAGRVLYDRPIGWSSSDTAVATIATSGDVHARSAGDATITATYGALRQTVRVRVAPAPPPPPPTVARAALAAYDTVMRLGDSVRLQVRALDGSGAVLPLVDRTVVWAVDAGQSAPLALSAQDGPDDSSARWVRATNVGIGRVAVAVDGVGTVATIRVAGPTPPATPQVTSIVVTVWTPDLVIGETSTVTAIGYDANRQVVTSAPLRIMSANPIAGTISQDSVSAGVAFGTLTAAAPGVFSVVAETWDGRVFAQTVVTARRPAALVAPVGTTGLTRSQGAVSIQPNRCRNAAAYCSHQASALPPRRM